MLLFTITTVGTEKTTVMTWDGDEEEALSDWKFMSFGSPSWSPDGTQILYSVLGQDSSYERTCVQYIANIDGTEIKKVFDKPYVCHAKWSHK